MVTAATPSSPRPDIERLHCGSTILYRCRLSDAARLNARIHARVCRLRDGDFTERSHFVGGRFENLYLDRDRIPELAILLEQSLRLAGAILERPPEQLRFGFWLNIMAPGDATSTHTHDESDELLSGVYYVVAPPDSGDLLIQDETASMRIAPRAGTLLFFPPSLAHGVAANRSAATRISVGLNIGPGRA